MDRFIVGRTLCTDTATCVPWICSIIREENADIVHELDAGTVLFRYARDACLCSVSALVDPPQQKWHPTPDRI